MKSERAPSVSATREPPAVRKYLEATRYHRVRPWVFIRREYGCLSPRAREHLHTVVLRHLELMADRGQVVPMDTYGGGVCYVRHAHVQGDLFR